MNKKSEREALIEEIKKVEKKIIEKKMPKSEMKMFQKHFQSANHFYRSNTLENMDLFEKSTDVFKESVYLNFISRIETSQRSFDENQKSNDIKKKLNEFQKTQCMNIKQTLEVVPMPFIPKKPEANIQKSIWKKKESNHE